MEDKFALVKFVPKFVDELSSMTSRTIIINTRSAFCSLFWSESSRGASYSFVFRATRWCASLCHLLASFGNLVGLACQIGSKRPNLYPGTRFYLGFGGGGGVSITTKLATQNTQNLSMVTAILNY